MKDENLIGMGLGITLGAILTIMLGWSEQLANMEAASGLTLVIVGGISYINRREL